MIRTVIIDVAARIRV